MIYTNSTTQCRYAPSLGGGFEAHPNEIWHTVPYKSRELPTVFCGLYDLRDFYALRRHKGKVWCFWCGSDIRNLRAGFTLNDGKLKLISRILGTWWVFKILKKAEHWCENENEQRDLAELGIKASVCPSFFGDVTKFNTSYWWSKNPHVYISTGKGRQIEYGFDTIESIAPRLKNVTFHLYGDDWKTKHKNVIVHGRIPIEQMNEEIKEMQCALYLNESGGTSEVMMKAILQGQYAISKIPHPLIPSYETEEELIQYLESLARTYHPNTKAQMYYLKALNRFPFNKNA